MKSVTIAVLIAGIAGLATMAEASTFTARSGARVNPVNAAVFEVIPRGRSSGQAYWCAAGDYAQRALRAPWTATVYIARGMGQSVTTGRRSAVQFTLDPGAAGITPAASSLSLNSLKPGENMSVQQAYSYCNVPPSRF